MLLSSFFLLQKSPNKVLIITGYCTWSILFTPFSKVFPPHFFLHCSSFTLYSSSSLSLFRLPSSSLILLLLFPLLLSLHYTTFILQPSLPPSLHLSQLSSLSLLPYLPPYFLPLSFLCRSVPSFLLWYSSFNLPLLIFPTQTSFLNLRHTSLFTFLHHSSSTTVTLLSLTLIIIAIFKGMRTVT